MYVNFSVDINVKPIVSGYSKYQRVERDKQSPEEAVVLCMPQEKKKRE